MSRRREVWRPVGEERVDPMAARGKQSMYGGGGMGNQAFGQRYAPRGGGMNGGSGGTGGSSAAMAGASSRGGYPRRPQAYGRGNYASYAPGPSVFYGEGAYGMDRVQYGQPYGQYFQPRFVQEPREIKSNAMGDRRVMASPRRNDVQGSGKGEAGVGMEQSLNEQGPNLNGREEGRRQSVEGSTWPSSYKEQDGSTQGTGIEDQRSQQHHNQHHLSQRHHNQQQHNQFLVPDEQQAEEETGTQDQGTSSTTLSGGRTGGHQQDTTTGNDGVHGSSNLKVNGGSPSQMEASSWSVDAGAMASDLGTSHQSPRGPAQALQQIEMQVAQLTSNASPPQGRWGDVESSSSPVHPSASSSTQSIRTPAAPESSSKETGDEHQHIQQEEFDNAGAVEVPTMVRVSSRAASPEVMSGDAESNGSNSEGASPRGGMQGSVGSEVQAPEVQEAEAAWAQQVHPESAEDGQMGLADEPTNLPGEASRDADIGAPLGTLDSLLEQGQGQEIQVIAAYASVSDDELLRLSAASALLRAQAQREEVERAAVFLARREIRRAQAVLDDAKDELARREEELQARCADAEQRAQESEASAARLKQLAEDLEKELHNHRQEVEEKAWLQEGQLREKASEAAALRDERDGLLAKSKAQATQLEAERAELKARIEELEGQLRGNEQQAQDAAQQLRNVQEELGKKDESVAQQAQSWEAHAAAMASLNQSLHTELRERTDQCNHLFVVHQQMRQQFAEGEQYHVQIIHQLQREVAELRGQPYRPLQLPVGRHQAFDHQQQHLQATHGDGGSKDSVDNTAAPPGAVGGPNLALQGNAVPFVPAVGIVGQNAGVGIHPPGGGPLAAPVAMRALGFGHPGAHAVPVAPSNTSGSTAAGTNNGSPAAPFFGFGPGEYGGPGPMNASIRPGFMPPAFGMRPLGVHMLPPEALGPRYAAGVHGAPGDRPPSGVYNPLGAVRQLAEQGQGGKGDNEGGVSNGSSPSRSGGSTVGPVGSAAGPANKGSSENQYGSAPGPQPPAFAAGPPHGPGASSLPTSGFTGVPSGAQWPQGPPQGAINAGYPSPSPGLLMLQHHALGAHQAGPPFAGLGVPGQAVLPPGVGPVALPSPHPPSIPSPLPPTPLPGPPVPSGIPGVAHSSPLPPQPAAGSNLFKETPAGYPIPQHMVVQEMRGPSPVPVPPGFGPPGTASQMGAVGLLVPTVPTATSQSGSQGVSAGHYPPVDPSLQFGQPPQLPDSHAEEQDEQEEGRGDRDNTKPDSLVGQAETLSEASVASQEAMAGSYPEQELSQAEKVQGQHLPHGQNTIAGEQQQLQQNAQLIAAPGQPEQMQKVGAGSVTGAAPEASSEQIHATRESQEAEAQVVQAEFVVSQQEVGSTHAAQTSELLPVSVNLQPLQPNQPRQPQQPQQPALQQHSQQGSQRQLMDERSLLTCLVRTLSTGQGVGLQISTTVSNRLARLLSPLTWEDYRPRYGVLAQFIAAHPELFIMDGLDKVSLREGAHAIVASLSVGPPAYKSTPVSFSSSANSSTRLPDVAIAVTPVAAAPTPGALPPAGHDGVHLYQQSAGGPGSGGQGNYSEMAPGSSSGSTNGVNVAPMAPPGLGQLSGTAARAPAPHSYYNRQHGNTRGPIGQNYCRRPVYTQVYNVQDAQVTSVRTPDGHYSLYGSGHYANGTS